MSDWYSRLRFILFRIAIGAAFAVLIVRLWNLQVVSSEEYLEAADRNRFRLVPIDAPRGVIYDRNGRLLVRNVPSFTVSIIRGDLPRDPAEREAVLARVADLLAPYLDGQGPEAIEKILDQSKEGLYVPIRIAERVERETVFVLEEERYKLPGVIVEVEPRRYYYDAPLMAHIIGYMGHISPDKVAEYIQKGYAPDDMVGVAGLERSQEALLAGTKGRKHIEVDAFGREVAVLASQPPVPGNSLYLTIDTEFQRAVEEALKKGMEAAKSEIGVAIAMDPRTGAILAMVSLPTFDNNLFAEGISQEDFTRLTTDPRYPLVNHAISGQFPPGSTFKIVPAVAGLQEGVIRPSTTLECRGTLLLPNRYFPDDLTRAQPFYCWNKAGHGSINVVQAIAQSCNIFFYQVAGGYEDFKGLGVERLAEYATLFGFGEPTGIELPGEASGLIPSDRWKRQTYGESWYTGDTYNAAIGQGFILATPLQLLNATAAIANRGTLYRPQLVYQVVDSKGHIVRSLEPEPIRTLPVDPEYIEVVRRGMRLAVTGGTAWRLNLPEIPVAAKTGTAQFTKLDEEGRLILDSKGNLPTHAWFTAFAPYDDPEIALVVFLEGGGEGSQYGAPVGEEILRAYFRIPKPEPEPTVLP